ncbi:hypothetical protein PHK61_14995 [Actinomycetospora lutea]|uniref:hypothetical protein n=1 Tax=Actinomycetospora lutea TaxID=663604 RepID=UPI002366822A|nr:hypothetical protein [Actinomycetospora lutea]MDD7939730.1 hypothetical protein [Actinomycetospora lutea]
MSREAATTAGLLIIAREAMEQFVDVHVDDDGALSFRHAGVPCAIQGVELVEGLAVLSLTCVVAWDLADTDTPRRVAERAGQGLFGTLGAVATEQGWDVTLRYAFPAEGLAVGPLGTLLMLVVSTAARVRGDLAADA